jgi:hypothetical protein
MPREDPFKDSGRDSEDPFKDFGRDSEDPFKDFGRGTGEAPLAGAGGGWVVVAFVSPIGMSVPELAVNMLRGGQRPSGGVPGGIGRTAVLAQDKARKQAAERKKDQELARAYEEERRKQAGARTKK